jgi:transcriptional regulator with XRE-family HTH domain
MAPRTGAERYFARQMEDPEYRAAYKDARKRVGRTDALVRSLDERRSAKGMSKAALARKAGLPPEAVRRLFTVKAPNPTAGTLVALAEALDLEVVARPKAPARRGSKSNSRAVRVHGAPVATKADSPSKATAAKGATAVTSTPRGRVRSGAS